LVRHGDRFALWLGIAATVALSLLAVTIHPCEIPDFENDRYHFAAEQLLAGQWPRDPYRPMLYVSLVAGLGALLGDCFLAGKLVSALASGLTILVVYQLGKRTYGRGTGLVAALLLAVSPAFLQYGMVVGTDSLFVLLMVTCLLATVRAAQDPGMVWATAAGLSFAAAWSSRYAAIAILPVVLLGVAIGASPGRRWRRCVSSGLMILLGLAPHMVVTSLQFGTLLHDENWRNLALRHFAPTLDFQYLLNNPFDGLWSVLRHDPGTILRHAMQELEGASNYGIQSLMTGGRLPLLAGSVGLVMIGFAAMLGWERRPRAVAVLVTGTISYLLLVCVTFFTWERMLLPLLPMLLLLLAWSLMHLPPGAMLHTPSSRLPQRLRIAGPALVMVLFAVASVGRLTTFASSHPAPMIDFARSLVATCEAPPALLSNYGFLDRHVACRHQCIAVAATPAVAFDAIAGAVKGGSFDYVILYKATPADPSWSALAAAEPPAWLERVRVDADLCAYRIVKQ
jgi:4-amino-4-deoxy-L-arabinose transferase-like glycosyltransferase